MIFCANPLFQYQSHREEIFEAIKNVLENGNYILGPQVEIFEKNFASYCGVNHAFGVNSGTDALILALRALDIGSGDEVITVSHTALATVAAIIACGATPVLVDIEPDYYTINPESLEKVITHKSKAIIPVHLYGQVADMDAIMSIAHERDLFVVEDCAQATGAIYKNKRVGSIGDVGCFSFYPTKNLGAIGDGGMVVTQNKEFAERVQQIRQYGWDKNRVSKREPGLNSRLDEIQAAILNVKLKYLDQDNTQRRQIAQLYNERLAELPVVLPLERLNTTHVRHLYVVVCENRDQLQKKLAENGIFTGVHYPIACHQQNGYKKQCVSDRSQLFITEELVDKILSFPIYPEMSFSQTEDIIALILNAFRC